MVYLELRKKEDKSKKKKKAYKAKWDEICSLNSLGGHMLWRIQVKEEKKFNQVRGNLIL